MFRIFWHLFLCLWVCYQVFFVSRVQEWAVSFGKEIAALSARYSGAKLLQKVWDCTHPLINHNQYNTHFNLWLWSYNVVNENWIHITSSCLTEMGGASPSLLLHRPTKTWLTGIHLPSAHGLKTIMVIYLPSQIHLTHKHKCTGTHYGSLKTVSL